MALAERRPVNFPETSTPASPSFDSTSYGKSSASGGLVSSVTSSDSKKDVKPLTPENSLSPMDMSPSSRSVSPDSLVHLELKQSGSASPDSHSSVNMAQEAHLGSPSNLARSPLNSPLASSSMANSYIKKPKLSSRAPIATGISTTIPVTGEKPRPEQKNDASLQDDVLYAIFLILYEKDPQGQGMTVKQICDTLVERHPEMATLLTKTSNLVLAKLNAYVKRVEKGDSNLKYALLRDWADASPKRMVYVYRGLLTHDFHLHVKLMNHKGSSGSSSSDFKLEFSGPSLTNSGTEPELTPSPAAASTSASGNGGNGPKLKQRRLTMYDLGINKHLFLDAPIDRANLFVPYSSAPVTASLSGAVHEDAERELDNDLEDFEVFDDDDEDDDDVEFKFLNNKAKRSKSLSYLSSKKTKIMTAAAAAPRVPRSPSQHSPSAAAAAAALHAAAVKSMMTMSNEDNNPCLAAECPGNKKWLSVVRSGFLTQEIGTPEDISLSDLDSLF